MLCVSVAMPRRSFPSDQNTLDQCKYHCISVACIIGNIVSGEDIKQTNSRPDRTSSNQYANGTNQNVGNVITGRRMTRVSAPQAVILPFLSRICLTANRSTLC